MFIRHSFIFNSQETNDMERKQINWLSTRHILNGIRADFSTEHNAIKEAFSTEHR